MHDVNFNLIHYLMIQLSPIIKYLLIKDYSNCLIYVKFLITFINLYSHQQIANRLLSLLIMKSL